MQEIRLSRTEARRLMLSHQGLWPPREASGKEAALDSVRRLGCIQYDPLNIVGRNPDLVLQSRLSDYKPAILNSLLYEDRQLVDGWDKNMSIYRVEDWPYFQRYRDGAKKNFGSDSRPAVSILPQVREMIGERGPLSSLDLEFDQTVDWSWGPTRMARAALESMYSWGELVIHHRVNTRKVYDFTSRHLPGDILAAAEPNVTGEQYDDWRVLRRIGGIGLIWNRSGDAWLGIRGLKAKEREGAFSRLIDQEKVIEVHVEGFDVPLYIRSQDHALVSFAKDHSSQQEEAVILAPLDNLLWDRRFIRQLFDFYYVWEVYKPAAERRFGYYVLPILYGDRFIARFEPGRDKESGALTIKNWWWESRVTQTDQMRSAVKRCFDQFLSYLGTDSLRVTESVGELQGIGWISG